MKTGTVLAAAAAAVLTRASPLGARQGGERVTVMAYAGYDDPTSAPAQTLELRSPGTTLFPGEGYAQVCAITRDPACAAYALVDGKPNIDAAHPEAGASARPLFMTPAPDFDYQICVSLRGHTEFPDGTSRDDFWRVRGVRLECGGQNAAAAAAAAVAARAPPAPASVERMGNAFFVHYEG